MKRSFVVILAAVLTLASAASVFADASVEKLTDISVTIKTDRGQGSGTLFVRRNGNDEVAYVWTAAHVVESLRKVRPVIDTKTGTNKFVVEFKDAEIVQELNQDGRRIGEIKMDAEVVRYSDAEQGHDLALLRVRKKNFVPADQTATFFLDEPIPGQGTELFHVGSLLGQVGANSLTTGIISQNGRVLKFGANAVIFDQTTVTAFPGSSGGGVYLKGDGRYVGMLVRGAGETFNLIVPVRRMREWAKKAGVEFAMDPRVEMPSDEDFKRIPVEDSGLPESIRSDKSAASPTPAEANYLFRWNNPPQPASRLKLEVSVESRPPAPSLPAD
jgi:hypothetical protein